jgi:hypothetical protein
MLHKYDLKHAISLVVPMLLSQLSGRPAQVCSSVSATTFCIPRTNIPRSFLTVRGVDAAADTVATLDDNDIDTMTLKD